MPYKDCMTWVKSQNRWVKLVPQKDGKRKPYYFVPKKHGVEPTEAGSREAMRSWWAGQQAILNSSVDEKQKAIARMFLTTLLDLRPANQQHTIEETQICTALAIEEIKNNAIGLEYPEIVKESADCVLGVGRFDQLKQLTDEVAKVAVKQIPQAKLISFHVDEFEQMLRDEVARGAIKCGSLRSYFNQTNLIREHFGTATVDSIDDTAVLGYWAMLSEKNLSADTVMGHERTFKRFVSRLVGKKVIPTLPWELQKVRKKVRKVRVKKQPWSVEQYQAELAQATGVKRLVLLLAANCSMYASDCSECLEYFDAEAGTIDKSRFKTGAVNVLFHLWPETIEAMKAHGSELKALYSEGMKNGKPFTKNKTRAWKFALPLKQLRHTTHTFLQNSDYAKYCDYMTGLAASGISKVWYASTEQPAVKQAFDYLRTRYGFK